MKLNNLNNQGKDKRVSAEETPVHTEEENPEPKTEEKPEEKTEEKTEEPEEKPHRKPLPVLPSKPEGEQVLFLFIL